MEYKENNIHETIDGIDPIEVEAIEKKLHQYLVKYPDEYMVDETIDTLRQYVPDKKNESQKLAKRFWTLIKHSKGELSFISKSYWMVTTLLFILGYWITTYGAYNPLLTLVMLAPVPFVLGLVEVFKGREQGLLEMEMACKFSIYEVMLSRLVLIGLFNIGLNTMLTIGFAPLLDTVSILKVLFIWFTPFTMFAAMALWLSMKVRGAVFTITFASLWMIFSTVVASNTAWGDFIVNMHMALHLLFTTLGMTMLGFQIKQLIKKYSSYEEVRIIEISH